MKPRAASLLRSLFCFCSVAAVAASALSAADPSVSGAPDRQKFNLYEEAPKARFVVKDISWPAKVGEAEICLWHDDKLAALSITVDDNPVADIPWWNEQGAKYGFPVTWFIITGRVDGEGGRWGTWKQLAELNSHPGGHSVESHTVMHLNIDKPGWESIEWEYTHSKRQLDANIPGKSASVLAYPGGPNTKLNDYAIAAKYYRSARGARGSPNPANQINYLATNGMSGINVGEEKHAWSDVNNILSADKYRGMYYRGWAVFLQHNMPDAQKAKIQPLFDFIAQHRDVLWLGLFADVAKYGQERDTATLKVTDVTKDRIRLTLTDLMDDSYFTYPLTVKVRVPDDWTSVVAKQVGWEARSRLVEHEGARYALVDVVPDGGVAELSPR